MAPEPRVRILDLEAADELGDGRGGNGGEVWSVNDASVELVASVELGVDKLDAVAELNAIGVVICADSGGTDLEEMALERCEGASELLRTVVVEGERLEDVEVTGRVVVEMADVLDNDSVVEVVVEVVEVGSAVVPGFPALSVKHESSSLG